MREAFHIPPAMSMTWTSGGISLLGNAMSAAWSRCTI